MSEVQTKGFAGKALSWAAVIAWVVTAIVSFGFFNTLESSRGDGFGDLGFMLVALTGMGVAFFLGFLPLLIVHLKHSSDGTWKGSLIGVAVALAIMLVEFLVIMLR